MKVVYIGPGDVHFRVGFTDMVYHFVPENNWTIDADRDLMYDLIAAERIGMYMKIEGDPKAIPRSTFTDPGVRQMNTQPIRPDTVLLDNGVQTKEIDINTVLDEVVLKPEAPATLQDEMNDPAVQSDIDKLLNGETTPTNTIVAEVQSETEVQSALS